MADRACIGSDRGCGARQRGAGLAGGHCKARHGGASRTRKYLPVMEPTAPSRGLGAEPTAMAALPVCARRPMAAPALGFYHLLGGKET